MAQSQHRVSLCMIVANEEKNLHDCLAPIHHLFDEIVVVDTGSTDSTRSIAESFGARIVDFPWTDSFADARNASMQAATGDYLFWFDADDRLNPTNVTRLKQLIASLDGSNTAYVMSTLCETPPGEDGPTVVNHPRLFKAHPDLNWTYRVHEQIMPCIEQLNYTVSFSDVAITHLGYQSQDVVHRKANRNLRLSRLDYVVHPEDPCVLFHIGQECARVGNHAEALMYLLKSLKLVKTRANWVGRLYGDIITAMCILGRRREALSMALEAVTNFGTNPELLMFEAELLEEHGDRVGAERTLRRLLDTPLRPCFRSGMPVDGFRRKAQRMLSALYINQHRFDEAETILQMLIADHPNYPDAWMLLGFIYIGRQHWVKTDFVCRQLRKLPDGEAYGCCVQAEMLRVQGQVGEAIDLAERATVLAPKMLLPHALAFDLLVAAGAAPGRCREAVLKVLKLSPGNAMAQRALDELNRLAEASSILCSRVTVSSAAPLNN